MLERAGIVLFAENNGIYDYWSMSHSAGARAQRFLSLPYTVVPYSNSWSYFKEYDDGQRGPHLTSSVATYLLESPYRYTLLMDADFVVMTPSLVEEIEKFILSEDPYRFILPRNIHHLNVVPRNTADLWMTLFLFDKENPMTLKLQQEAAKLTARWQMLALQLAVSPDTFDRNLVFREAAKLVGAAPSFESSYVFNYSREFWRGGEEERDTHVTHKSSLLKWYKHD